MFKRGLKKFLILGTVGIMTFSLTGCGGKERDKIIIHMTHTQQPESISDLTSNKLKNMLKKNQMEEFKLIFIKIADFQVET